MKFALVNPNWSFEGGIYFGCQEPHLPLELGYSRALLQEHGYEVLLLNAHSENLNDDEIYEKLSAFRPDFTAITTTNSYLFWRCAQPELRVPIQLIEQIREVAGFLIVVGPHSSTTPVAALRKLNPDVAVMGECEEILPLIAANTDSLDQVPSIAYFKDGTPVIQGTPHACDMETLPALHWESRDIQTHSHHHHRFDKPQAGPGAEMEVSRGCPYHCTFCAKENFRNLYRKRPQQTILKELDSLLSAGARYIYFIDEIFLPDKSLLDEFISRNFKFGIQTRIDLWSLELLELLGKAGCVSIEAGIESITPEGRAQLDKKCRLTTDELSARLLYAKDRVPFVQANLLESESDDPVEIENWRNNLIHQGVWANKPVPLFPYPGSPEYTRKWGAPDEYAWERAQNYYLQTFDNFSDIQHQRPLKLEDLEFARKNRE